MNRKNNLLLLPLGILCVVYLFINLNVQNIFKVVHNIAQYKERFRHIKNYNITKNTTMSQTGNNSYDSTKKLNKTNQLIKNIKIPDRKFEPKLKNDEDEKNINITDKLIGRINTYKQFNATLSKNIESVDKIVKPQLNNGTKRETNKTNESIHEFNKTIEKTTGILKISNQSVETIEVTEKMNLEYPLNLEQMLLPDSDTTWPVVVMKNNGRTGNCFNSYGISLALNMEFGDKATIAIQRYVHNMVAKVIDIHGLILPIAENTFNIKAVEKKLAVGPPGNFYVKNDYVAHIKPSIKYEITEFQTTKKKKILFIGGYPNRMYMIADYQDEIRRRLRVKSDLLKKAQTFLLKVSEGRRPGMIFVGFHIRRTDYVAHSKTYNGVGVPGPKYYAAALAHYRQRFDNVMFVVASDNITYAKSHLQHHTDVVFTEFKALEEDMALLSLCNHSIMTVGSFGWWSSFLAGGDVVYALLYNFTIPPFAHPDMLGPRGFENFIGIPVTD